MLISINCNNINEYHLMQFDCVEAQQTVGQMNLLIETTNTTQNTLQYMILYLHGFV